MSEHIIGRSVVALLIVARLALPQSIKSGQPSSTLESGPSLQQPQADATTDKKRAMKVNMVVLLDSLFTAADDFPDEMLRIKTQMRIADVLWAHDEERAREDFLKTYDAINRIPQDKQKPAFTQFISRVQLRGSLLALVGRHDRKWADSLLQESLTHDAAEAALGMTTSDQQSLERIKVAEGTMQFDAESAAKMLSGAAGDIDWKGMAGRVFAVTLNQLRQQDAKMADDVLIQALVAAQGNSSMDFESLANLIECMWPIRRDQNDLQGPDIIRQFLVMAEPIILRRANDPGPFVTRADNPLPDWRQMLLAFYDEYMPEEASLIHKKLSYVPPMEGPRRAWWNLSSDNTRLYRDEAKTAGTDRAKDSTYGDSALSFAAQGRIEDAFSTARNISNELLRSQIETAIRQNAVDHAVKSDDARAVYRYAKEEPTRARADMFIQAISAALKKRDTEFATSLLAEIENWMGQQADLRADPRAWLKLGDVAIRIDAAHGFQVMRLAVKVINGTDFSVAGMSPKPENQIRENQQKVLRLKADSLEYRPFGLLADVDFPLALGIAQEIRRKEVSVLAQLAICERLLGHAQVAGSEKRQKTAF
jgi:hypothetical protein